MNKFYQVKTYSITGTFKHTINPSIIKSEISFSQGINGGQGQLNLDLNTTFDNNNYLQGDIIEIKVYSDYNPTGLSLYSGIITGITRIQTIDTEGINLSCLGVFTLLNNIIYDNGAGKVFTKSDEPKNILQDIVNYFNSQQVWVSASGNLGTTIIRTNLDIYGTNVNISFNYDNCLNAIKKVIGATTFWFYIDQNGYLYFKTKPVTSIHKLTMARNIEEISINENIDDITNKLYLERNGGTYQTYTDATSITTYSLKELQQSKTDLLDATTQNTAGNSYITDNKNPKKESTVIVNNNYNYEIIKPGDSIKTLNTKSQIDNVQIVQMSYGYNKCNLSLDKFKSFGDEIIS